MRGFTRRAILGVGMRAVWLLLLTGCAGVDDPISPCRPGFALGPDDHCYPPPPEYPAPVATDVLENLADCELRDATGEIDLAGGCVLGVCAGDRFEDVDAVLEGNADCDSIADSTDVSCTWANVGGRFGTDDDGAPRPTARAQWIRALRPFGGTTKDGLGTRIAPRCFVEALGVPNQVLFEDALGELLVSQMAWDAYGIVVVDDEDRRNNAQPDGLIDELFLLGPP